MVVHLFQHQKQNEWHSHTWDYSVSLTVLKTNFPFYTVLIQLEIVELAIASYSNQ